MSNTALVQYQSIDEVVQSLSEVSERAKSHTAIEKIKPKKTLFGEAKTPTIKDINDLVNDVDGQLIDLKNFNIEILDKIKNVCVLLSALDKKHVDELLETATAAHEATKKANNNVKSINSIILILTSLQHLDDLDQIWKDNEKNKETLIALVKQKNELSQLQHIKDIDKLWDTDNAHTLSIEEIKKLIAELRKALDKQAETVEGINKTLCVLAENQTAFFAKINSVLADRQAEMEKQLDDCEKALNDVFASLKTQIEQSEDALNKRVVELSEEQSSVLKTMKAEQDDFLRKLEESQAEQLRAMQKTQETVLNQLKESQTSALNEIGKLESEKLEQIHEDQAQQLTSIKDTVDNEKRILTDTVASLTLKVKIAYLVAGGASAITIIHLLLSIWGVI